MPNLYQIRNEIENFVAECDEETGEFLNADAWDELNMAYEEKVENTACFIKNLRADILALKTEEANLEQRRKRLEKKAAWLEKLLLNNMSGEKFETAKCVVSFRKSVAVEVADMSVLPEHLLTIETTTKPNKTAIGKLLKAGQEVFGCKLTEKQNINIK